MQYTDIIYGAHEITEPIILELINTPAMQRLKGVDQA
jgi:HD superfamily phosphohydrolase